MTITFTPSANGVTLDETGGLQFNGSPDDTAGPTDNDDSDVSLATLQAQRASLFNVLFSTLALSTSFPTADGVAHGTIGTATSDTPITAISFSFTNGTFSGLFTDNGTKLYLYSTALFPDLVLLREADASNNPNPNGTIAAAINLDVNVDGTSTSEDVSVWMVQFEALKEPITTNADDTVILSNLSLNVASAVSFDFAGVHSGSNYFALVGSQSAALLVTGDHPVLDTTTTSISAGDTLVASQGGGPTTLGVNNQMLNPGEGMDFRFVTVASDNFIAPNLSSTEADVEANTAATGFVNTTGASITFVQTQPSASYFTASLTAFSADKSAPLETGTHYAEELHNDTPVAILLAGVQVLRGGVNVVGTDPAGAPPPVTASVANGVLTVSGLTAGDEIKYTTNGTHNHLLLQAVSGANFDVGGFSILSAQQSTFAINDIKFDDAGPSIATTGTEPTLTVDETVLATNATANFAPNFTSSFGTDGAGSLVYTLGVSAPGGVASGLVDTATNHGVFLFNESGVIVGREGADAANAVAGNIVFTASVNSATGVVTLDQQRAIVHPNTTDPNDSKTLAADTLITLTATITDADGDHSTAVLNIGQNLNFLDDGPSIATTGVEPTLTVDETVLATNATANFSPNFTSSFGADGAGTLTYALGVSAPGGVASGLVDTASGHGVFLFNESGVVVGREGTSAADAVGGDIVFIASVNATTGVVTLDQQRAIVHANTNDPNDSTTLSADTLITLTATITDKDGDPKSATLNIGQNLNFLDDGPTAQLANGGGTVTVDESAGLQSDDTTAAAVTALFGTVVNKAADLPTAQFAVSTTPLVSTSGSVGGADGIQSTVLSLAIVGGDGTDSLLDTTDGKNILLFKEGNLIVGRYDVANGPVDQTDPAAFAIAILQNGNAAIAQYASLHHPDPLNANEQIDLTGKISAVATVTDGDGDKSTANFGIGDKLNFNDDAPTLSAIPDSTNSLIYANGTTETKPFTFDAGADNENASVALTDFTDPDNAADLAASHLGQLETLLGVNITATQVGNTVTYFTPDGPDAGTAPDPLFQLSLTNSSWTFTILQDAPLVFNNFDFGTVSAGGPQEILSVEATNSNTFGVFNGYVYGPIDSPDGTDARGIFPPAPIDLPGSSGANTADDLNPDALGFGVKGGAASNMNNNEGFSVTFHDGSAGGPLKSVAGLSFNIQGQGNTDDIVLSFDLINGTQGGGNDPDIVAIEKGAGINLIANKALATVDDGGFWLRLGLPTGNNNIKFTILSDKFESAYTPAANEIAVYVHGDYQTDFFRMAYPDTNTFDQYPGQVGDSVRISNITLIETLPVPDMTLNFAAQGVDGDGDHTSVQPFHVFVSDDGGLIV